VLIVIMGQSNSDYGWLENEKGDIIVSYNFNQSLFAGGSNDNRIQIFLDTLDAGKYRIRYLSDYRHSFAYWYGTKPYFPEHWGIQVFSTVGELEYIQQLLKKRHYVPVTTEIFTILEDVITGNLLVRSSSPSLWTFDIDRKKFLRLKSLVDSTFTYSTYSSGSYYQARDGSIWISYDCGLVQIEPQSKQYNFYQVIPSKNYISDNHFTLTMVDDNGIIWGGLSSIGGLLSFDPKTEKFQRYQYDRNNPNSLSRATLWSLYKDHMGIIWIGTWEGGINKWDRNKWKFKHYRHNPQNPNSLSHDRVWSIYVESNGIIWLGTNGGLNRFDRSTGIFDHYKYPSQNLLNYSVNAIFQDTSGYIWLGTYPFGLARFDPDRETFRFYSHDPEDSTSLSDKYVTSLYEDNLGVLWVGTPGGLNQFDRRTGKFSRFQHDPNKSGSLSQNEVRSIYEDQSGILWVGTNSGGLNRFDRKTGQFEHYKSLLSGLQVRSSITCIYEDRQGNFWVGTRKSGIHLFDRNNGTTIKNFTEKDGLVNNCVQAILEDDSGNLWISTKNGLSKFNPRSNTFKNYDVSDGLQDNEFWINSSFRSPTGEMIFGGENGFNIFHPDSVKDDPIPPQVVITNLTLFNRPEDTLNIDKHISESDLIQLSYNQNDLYFEFVGLHFGEPIKNRYKYKLENYNDNWVDAGNQRNATYTNLDPGEYIFRVKAANRDGVWNEEGASISIIIDNVGIFVLCLVINWDNLLCMENAIEESKD